MLNRDYFVAGTTGSISIVLLIDYIRMSDIT